MLGLGLGLGLELGLGLGLGLGLRARAFTWKHFMSRVERVVHIAVSTASSQTSTGPPAVTW